jgi:hypothetical protein
MMDRKQLDQALSFIRSRWPNARPTLGLILGSGWSEVVESFTIKDTIPYEEIPGLGKTGVVGHAGRLVLAESSGIETLIFQGRRHFYEGVGWTPIALPVFLIKSLGAKAVMVTNAAGGVRADLKPGSLMIIDDHINFLGANPLIGAHDPVWGPPLPGPVGSLQYEVAQIAGPGRHRGRRNAAPRCLSRRFRPHLRIAGRNPRLPHPGRGRGGHVDGPGGVARQRGGIESGGIVLHHQPGRRDQQAGR